MKKGEFVSAVAKQAGVTQKVIEGVFDAMAEIIVKEVRDNGEPILIQGVGTFKQKINPAREGINPLTKEPLSIKKSTTIAFKALPSVKVTSKK